MKTSILFCKRLLVMFTVLVMGMGAVWASGDIKDDYTGMYLTIESLVDNDTITLSIPQGITSEQLTMVSYSTDETSWTTLEIEDTLQIITIVLNQGGKVYFKGLGSRYATQSVTNYCHINGTGDYLVYGNIMSLLYGDDFASQTTFPDGSDFAFFKLFSNNHHLVSVENLVLPATSLAPYCYSYMFYACSRITSAPVLPATTLTAECYRNMFWGCTSLAEVTCLATDISAHACVSDWLYEVAPSGFFIKDPEMEDWQVDSPSGIPEGWNTASYDALDEQNEQNGQIAVYPNPVINRLHITGKGIQSVKVFNTQGRMFHSEECGFANQAEVDFQAYARGIYTVLILSEGSNVIRKVVF